MYCTNTKEYLRVPLTCLQKWASGEMEHNGGLRFKGAEKGEDRKQEKELGSMAIVFTN